MSSNTAQILRAAREKIATPERWTQEICARNREGLGVTVRSAEACSWCILGAIGTVSESAKLVYSSARKLRKIVKSNVSIWNDAPDRTHAEVLAAFDAAIAAEESRP